jgi:predicted DNA-binding protein
MAQVQLATRIDGRLKKALETVCRGRGITIAHFVQEAVLDKLEELDDIEDLKKIRHEPTRPLSDVLAELRRDGKL